MEPIVSEPGCRTHRYLHTMAGNFAVARSSIIITSQLKFSCYPIAFRMHMEILPSEKSLAFQRKLLNQWQRHSVPCITFHSLIHEQLFLTECHSPDQTNAVNSWPFHLNGQFWIFRKLPHTHFTQSSFQSSRTTTCFWSVRFVLCTLKVQHNARQSLSSKEKPATGKYILNRDLSHLHRCFIARKLERLRQLSYNSE